MVIWQPERKKEKDLVSHSYSITIPVMFIIIAKEKYFISYISYISIFYEILLL